MTFRETYFPCRNEGCDNRLIAEISQEEGVCRQCAKRWAEDAAYYGALYAREKAKGMGDWEIKAEHMDMAGAPNRCEMCGDPVPPSVTECALCKSYGEPCQSCGQRGQMKGGDPDDCRSVDCMGSRCDAAMDAMEDR